MARARLSMDDIEEMLRLHYGCNLSQRKVARSCGVSLGTVNKVLRRAAQAGLGWPLPEGMTGKELQDLVYGPAPGAAPAVWIRRRALEFEAMHFDLQRRRHFTVRLAWEEYSAQHKDAYSYSQFCKLYREWQARHDVTMAQHHKAGEKLFVDYAGSTVTVHAANDPPVKVLVVDDLLSDRMTGRSVNFRGTETHVIPLDAGPSVPAAPTASGHAFQHKRWSGRSGPAACGCRTATTPATPS